MKNLIFYLIFVPLVSFSQKDSTKFIDNFYLELNFGYGEMTYTNQEYLAKYGIYDYYEYTDRSYNFSVNLFYKNKWLLTGVTGQYLLTNVHSLKSLSYMLSLNVLFKEQTKNNFLGPFFSYGYITNSYEVFPRYAIGLLCQIKHIHVAAKHDWFKRQPNATSFIDATNFYLEVGYAFNLESFRKKK